MDSKWVAEPFVPCRSVSLCSDTLAFARKRFYLPSRLVHCTDGHPTTKKKILPEPQFKDIDHLDLKCLEERCPLASSTLTLQSQERNRKEKPQRTLLLSRQSNSNTPS